jgi:hypothetical protein
MHLTDETAVVIAFVPAHTTRKFTVLHKFTVFLREPYNDCYSEYQASWHWTLADAITEADLRKRERRNILLKRLDEIEKENE